MEMKVPGIGKKGIVSIEKYDEKSRIGFGLFDGYPVFVENGLPGKEYEIEINWLRPANDEETRIYKKEAVLFGKIAEKIAPEKTVENNFPVKPGDTFSLEILKIDDSGRGYNTFVSYYKKNGIKDIPVFSKGYSKSRSIDKIIGNKYDLKIDVIAIGKKGPFIRATPIETIERVKKEYPYIKTVSDKIEQRDHVFAFLEKSRELKNLGVFFIDNKISLVEGARPNSFYVVDMMKMGEKHNKARLMKYFDFH
ncbi:MAG TPA: hypothetical protein VJB11_03635 [archaeon]|nr:hypothetical protein [archaeon]